MNKKEAEDHIIFPKETNVATEKRGEIPCLIVYSDKTHVDYINNILNPIRDLLPELGFNPIFLSEQIESLKHYGFTVEQLASQCPLGIVILDGLRPNVLFELGILFGKNKPIIIIQDERAKVSIKSYYNCNFNNSKLSQIQFNKLCEPPLGYLKHISDLGGLHIIKVNRRAAIDDKNHPKNVLKIEINKIESAITVEYNRILLESEPLIKGEHFEKFQSVVIEISDFYIQSKGYKVENLENSIKNLEEIEENAKIKLPHQVYSNIAALFVRLAKDENWKNTKIILSYFQSAINVYNKIANFIIDDLVHSQTKFRLGNMYYEIAIYDNRTANCKKAINAYKEALKVYSYEQFPMDYGMTQNNLGNVYGTLAEVESKANNCNKAINALKEALKVRTLEQFPMQYGNTQNNLGNAYNTLAEVESKSANCKKAINAYKEALKVYSLEQFPMQYSTTQNNLGTAYGRLAEVESKANNCNKAINALKEVLKVRTLEQFPMQYGNTQNNLGNAYNTLAEVESKANNCNKAINAYKEALKVYTKELSIEMYKLIMYNFASCLKFCK